MIGITSLACFSFIFTEKTAITLRDNDKLMKVIKEESEYYKIESKNAIVNDKTIIPGINGKSVNNNKSYDNMKRFGEFNQNMLIYDVIFPEISIKNMYNKYVVGGNPNKNMVSLIIKIDASDNINEIIKLLEPNTPINFFIDGAWLENNEQNLKKLTDLNYNIGNLSYNGNYLDSNFVWMKTIINKYSKQENSYCYLENENDEALNICSIQKSYTIIPSIVAKNNPLIGIKTLLKAGDIISLELNSKTLEELPLIIKYIKSKGYVLVSLDTHLSEDM